MQFSSPRGVPFKQATRSSLDIQIHNIYLHIMSGEVEADMVQAAEEQVVKISSAMVRNGLSLCVFPPS